ncbi:hypothetical protein RE6C_00627 [Rhodopirellula europaea 6C]|uniref:Uncharacterized protein n=1 Tax=Rhodopirellula europaea 6C TaxID=1263867 RepID=M2BAD8_9BACT|nr:hypothetical protein RE6C_00627 [Rhodopirellula europaea 6C]
MSDGNPRTGHSACFRFVGSGEWHHRGDALFLTACCSGCFNDFRLIA